VHGPKALYRETHRPGLLSGRRPESFLRARYRGHSLHSCDSPAGPPSHSTAPGPSLARGAGAIHCIAVIHRLQHGHIYRGFPRQGVATATDEGVLFTIRGSSDSLAGSLTSTQSSLKRASPKQPERALLRAPGLVIHWLIHRPLSRIRHYKTPPRPPQPRPLSSSNNTLARIQQRQRPWIR
jgi:hypothetical protein